MAADILEKILAVKREEVAPAKAAKPLAAVRAEAEAQAPARGFAGAIRLKVGAGKKRRSSPKSRRPARPRA
jgi:indole-3-glycerol phosphate synthase